MKKITILGTAILAAMFALTGCASDAQTVNNNITTAADQFEVQRSIVGINGITGTVEFQVEGRCSITDEGHQLEVICKHGPDEYRKHFIGLSDNTFYVAEQLDAIDVSEYHTRIVIKPESVLPNLDFETKAEEGPGH